MVYWLNHGLFVFLSACTSYVTTIITRIVAWNHRTVQLFCADCSIFMTSGILACDAGGRSSLAERIRMDNWRVCRPCLLAVLLIPYSRIRRDGRFIPAWKSAVMDAGKKGKKYDRLGEYGGSEGSGSSENFTLITIGCVWRLHLRPILGNHGLWSPKFGLGIHTII